LVEIPSSTQETWIESSKAVVASLPSSIQDTPTQSATAQDKNVVLLSKNLPDRVSDKVFNLIMDCVASLPDQVEMGQKMFHIGFIFNTF